MDALLAFMPVRLASREDSRGLWIPWDLESQMVVSRRVVSGN